MLRKLTVMRTLMRARQLGVEPDPGLPESAGATAEDLADLYRLLAIGKYDERYVIPLAHAEEAGRLTSQHEQLFCSLDTEGGPGVGGYGPPGPHGIRGYQPAHHGPGQPAAPAGSGQGGPGPPDSGHLFRADDGRTHFNLLGWNGRGSAPGLFPDCGPREQRGEAS